MSVDPVAFLEAVSVAYVLVMGFVALLAAIAVIGLWTNTASALVQFVESTEAVEPLIFQNVETNAVALVVGGVAALVGAGIGDRAAPNLRGLTVDELRRRITTRLREDYGVGNVDIELTEEGTVDYLAVGSRAAGIGPTPPAPATASTSGGTATGAPSAWRRGSCGQPAGISPR